MKFTPEIIAALNVLRHAAENDFERHRINVLERDLTAPPQVEIIDETHQRFNGEIYHKSKNGHFGRSYSIHRAVWHYCHGEIPADNRYEIHHKDFNPANNVPENLQLLTKLEHSRVHFLQAPVDSCCPNCGKTFTRTRLRNKFCSYQCAISFRTRPKVEKTCPVCGENFICKNNDQTCCSYSCARKLYFLQHKKAPVEKTCPICGVKFTPKDSRKKTCSKACANALTAQSNKMPPVEKKCPICGKIFICETSKEKKNQICCSISCANKMRGEKHASAKQTLNAS